MTGAEKNMKKTIGVVSHRKAMSEFYRDILIELFGDKTEIFACSLEDGSLATSPECDLYLYSATSYDMMRNPWALEYAPEPEKSVRSAITFSKAAVELLRTYPKGTRALLVNQSLHMALESISQLYHLGIDNIEFIPCYPEIETVPDIDLVFSTGEPDLVPPEKTHVVDLGNRLLTANTVCELALKLGDPFFIESEQFAKYRNRLANVDYSLSAISMNSLTVENKLEMILNSLDEGVVCVDNELKVNFINKTARKMLDVSRSEVLGRPVAECIPYIFDGISGDSIAYSTEPVLINVRGTDFGAYLRPLRFHDQNLGSFITLQQFNEKEKHQSELRLQLTGKSRKARYYLDDIVGDSPAIERTKKIAERIAESDANVMITGESGTGKHTFAQAIHNASTRKNGPFITVNCAAVNETLLETELFGYADGAFSGTKPGGKIGLAECAHRGTLFLEDVECLSQPLQAALVRVIREGEVTRIGSDEPVPVDIRFIASSCENMADLAKRGEFRKDLYYRLSVIPLQIPSLSQRKEDIPALIDFFMLKHDVTFTISDRARITLMRHKWDGNLRELSNCIEYLKCLGKNRIDTEDLPDQLQDKDAENTDLAIKLREDSNLTLREYRILQVLGELYLENKSAGRQNIVSRCLTKGFAVSEHEIRMTLKELKEKGYINIDVGRGGTRLTEQGYLYYREIEGESSAAAGSRD